MTTIQSILPMDRNALIALSKQKQEPEWLTALRVESLELAGSLEWPKVEKTNISKWNLDAYGTFQEAAKADAVSALPDDIQQLIQSQQASTNLIVQQNSSVVFSSIAKELADQGVLFMSLEQACKDHPDLVQPYLHTVVKKDENRLTALHAAMWCGGIFLYVPKNVRIEMPLQAIFYSENDQASFSPHILIVAEEHSSVSYVDNYISAPGMNPLVHNGVVEVIAKPGAEVHYATIHNLNALTTDLSIRRAIVQQDARMFWVIGELNDGNSLSDTSTILQGHGSSSDAKVISIGTKEQQMNITTRANHIGRSTTSDMVTRAVMRDRATAIINGITKMEKGCTNSNGEQTEKVLMLSPLARGDANPMLLIDEDEVMAGHAASVGQVDENHVYYLMSRGISKEEALRLIIYGFLAPIISEIPIEHVKQQLQSLVERKLHS